MSGEQFLVLVAALVVVWLAVRHQAGMRKYPEIGCSKCHGAGWRMAWIFHVASMRRRKVRGPCPKCLGSPWTARRHSGTGWS